MPARAPLTEGPAARLLPGVLGCAATGGSWLRYDVLAGVTVAAYLVPQVMAYAGGRRAASGRRAVGDRRAAARLRRARLLAPAVGRARVHDGADDGGRGRSDRRRRPGTLRRLAAALALVVGAWCVLGWVGRLGFLADLLSKPVLVGYMAGIAAIMVASQLGKLTGIDVDADSFASEIVVRRRAPGRDSRADAVVSLASVLAFLLVGSRLLPRSPVPLGGGCSWPPPRSRCSTSKAAESPSSGRSLPGCRAPSLPVGHCGRPGPPAAARGRGGDRGVHRQRADRAHLRGPQRLRDRRQPGVPRPRRRQPGVRRDAGVPGEQQRQPHGDRRLARQPQPAVLARRAGDRPADAGVPATRPGRLPAAALGAIVVYAATRLVDVAEFRRIARFRRSELFLALATTVAVLVARRPVRRPRRDRAVRSSICCAGWRGPTTGSSGTPLGSPACTTSTTTRTRGRCRDLSSTATTRRCSSPTSRTSSGGRWRPSTGPTLPSSGSCSTPRPTSRWTSPRSTPSTSCRQELDRRGIVFAMARVKQDLHDDLRRIGLRRPGGRGSRLHDAADSRAGVRPLVRRSTRHSAARRDCAEAPARSAGAERSREADGWAEQGADAWRSRRGCRWSR